MPVDLSRIGLDGIQQANQTRLMQAQAANLDSDTRLQQLQAEEAEIERRLDDQAAQLMQRLGSGNSISSSPLTDGEPLNRSDMLRKIGDLYVSGGASKRGKDLYSIANDLDTTENTLKNDVLNRQQDILDNTAKQSDIVARTLGSAKNQSEWDVARFKIFNNPAFTKEDLALLAQLPEEFDPNVAALLNEQALTAYQRATLELNKHTAERADAIAQHNMRVQDGQLRIAQERLKVAERDLELRERTGTSSTTPTTQEVELARRKIQEKIFAGKSDSIAKPNNAIAINTGAAAIASRAKAMLREDRAIDWDTALNRALIESQEAGDWNFTDTVSRVPVLGIEVSREKGTGATFSQKANGSKSRPLPPQSDPSKAIPGKYYTGKDGKVYKWTGQGFIPAD